MCAYGESPYLENASVLLPDKLPKATFLSLLLLRIIIFLLPQKNMVFPFISTRVKKVWRGDWNFGYDHAKTPLVTLAHQDDRYYKNYTEDVLAALNALPSPLLVFTDYNERRENRTVVSNHLLKVKRFMLLPMRFHCFWGSRFIRRRILSFGNPVCCPSVTFVKSDLSDFSFRNNMKSNIDWQAWENFHVAKESLPMCPGPVWSIVFIRIPPLPVFWKRKKERKKTSGFCGVFGQNGLRS